MNSTNVNSSQIYFDSEVDEKSGEVFFDSNDALKFLPFGMGKKFPKLLSLSAWYCSLESVTRENFQGLTLLQRMALNQNYLRSIKSGTFDDLANLKWLYLDYNQITVIQPNVFNNLKSLKVVSFMKNICVKLDYNETEIEAMKEDIMKNCLPPNEANETSNNEEKNEN